MVPARLADILDQLNTHPAASLESKVLEFKSWCKNQKELSYDVPMGKKNSEVDIDQMIHEVESSDETVRARALRRLCPCTEPWHLFAQHRALVQRLKKDPSSVVRRIALHIFDDAARHQSGGYPTQRRQSVDEMVGKKISSRFPTDEEELRERQKSRQRKAHRPRRS